MYQCTLEIILIHSSLFDKYFLGNYNTVDAGNKAINKTVKTPYPRGIYSLVLEDKQ